MNDLFDICAERHGQNQESAEANERIEPFKGSLREEVLRFVQERRDRGATTEEISRGLDLPYTTASARISELKRLGLVRASGQRRPTSRGCSAAVLVG
jgi:DNA-binding transcriptional ArsR family regulator